MPDDTFLFVLICTNTFDAGKVVSVHLSKECAVSALNRQYYPEQYRVVRYVAGFEISKTLSIKLQPNGRFK